jgi:hypothetical protein
MNRGDIKNYAAFLTPQVKFSTAPGDTVNNMVQMAADEIAARTLCLPKDTKFNAVAGSTGVGEYSLSTIDSEFVQIADSGLYWNAGTVASPDYTQLDPVTLKWLDENRRKWREEPAGDPQVFYQDGDTLGVFPAPADDLTDGFWLYYGTKAFTMINDDHYPFYGTSEIGRLTILDRAIALHLKIQVLSAADKVDSYRQAEKQYEGEISKVKGILMTNRAVLNSRYNRFQGRKIRNTWR